ncbi:MAG: hypothetical protein ACLFSB_02385 [Chitinispirillaceae bacterium]
MKNLVYVSLMCVSAITGVFSQVVVFNEPAPWMTLRDPKVEANILMDTAALEQNSIRVKLLKNQAGRQTAISNRTFSIQDFPENISIGAVDEKTIGGQSFLEIQWSIPGADKQGSIAPLGLAMIESAEEDTLLNVREVDEVSDAPTLGEALGDSVLSVQSYGVGAGYTDSLLYIYLRKEKDEAGTITFAFDGKNGKNAFTSFSDRYISYSDSSDTLLTYNFTRSFKGDSIEYERKRWYSSIEKAENDNQIMISIPWHDIGFLPFEGRRFGLAILLSQKNGDGFSLPQQAEMFIPATWSSAVLIPEKK